MKRMHVWMLLLLTFLIGILLKLLPYIVYKYDYLIGFDSGKYILDLASQTSTSRATLNLWVEPGLNSTLNILNIFTTLPYVTYFKYLLPFVVTAYFIYFVYLFTYKITTSYSSAIISALFLATSTVFLNSTFDSYYRQIFSSMIFIAFFYYLEDAIFNNKLYKMRLLFLGILGAGIIFSHRGVTLLYILLLMVNLVFFGMKKEFDVVKKLILIMITSLVLSSVYWYSILIDNITIFKDTIALSLSGTHGGNTTIRELKRTDNQIIGYIVTISVSFIPLLGLVLWWIKKKGQPFVYFTSLLLVYIFIKATFSSRFLFNLDILLAILAGISFFYLKKIINKKVVSSLMILLLFLNFIHTSETALHRTPYVTKKTQSIKWLEENLDKSSYVIVAPDALSTVLAQMNFKTALYEYKQLPKTVDSITFTENALLKGFDDPSFIKEIKGSPKNVYVAFGDWNLENPLSKSQMLIPLDSWDKSKYFKKIYEGDQVLKRVYLYEL